MIRTYATVAVGVAVVGLAVTGWLALMPDAGGDRYAQCRASTVAGGAGQLGGPFTLVNEQGATVTDAQVITTPSLVYFGYTFCPDVCPLDVSRNAEAIDILESRGKIVQPVFITVDPARDTPDVLADFTDAMHPRMVGLTGSDEQVRAASQAYRTYYRKQQPDQADPDYYLMDHSTFSYLVFPGAAPDGGFVEFFRRDLPADQLADRVQCFLDAA